MTTERRTAVIRPRRPLRCLRPRRRSEVPEQPIDQQEDDDGAEAPAPQLPRPQPRDAPPQQIVHGERVARGDEPSVKAVCSGVNRRRMPSPRRRLLRYPRLEPECHSTYLGTTVKTLSLLKSLTVL